MIYLDGLIAFFGLLFADVAAESVLDDVLHCRRQEIRLGKRPMDCRDGVYLF